MGGVGSALEMVALTLDHLLVYGDVDRIVDRVVAEVGAEPDDGGTHPGRGTRNAVFVMAGEHALEVLGADPAQDAPPPWAPRFPPGGGILWWWAVRTDAPIEETRAYLRRHGLATSEPETGERRRPDGGRVGWTLLDVVDHPFGTAMPFVIGWEERAAPWRASVRPRCELRGFRIAHPGAEALSAVFARLGLGTRVEPGEQPSLEVDMVGPTGTVRFTSG